MIFLLAQADGDAPPDIPALDYGSTLGNILWSLLLLIILMIATCWVLKRLIHGKFQKSSGARSIQILERRPLSPKSMLYLVEVEGQKIFLAESQVEVRRLTSWAAEEEGIERKPPTHSG